MEELIQIPDLGDDAIYRNENSSQDIFFNCCEKYAKDNYLKHNIKIEPYVYDLEDVNKNLLFGFNDTKAEPS